MTLNEKLDSLGLKAMSPAPSYRQAEWLRRERSIFFHFGINTFTNMEWGDGSESPSIFNPEQLDCRQWIKTIRDAGFKAAILTAKHHDGFCLWPSKLTEHSIKNSPYKNGNGDIVKEFTDACAEFGIKAGIYLSPWDRHEKTWGAPEYNDFYTAQLTELLTNYGKIWEVWWDGAGSTEADYDWERWATTVRKLQPDAVIFGSLGAEPFVETRWVGNEKGFAGDPCWCSVRSETLITEKTSDLNTGDLYGNRFIPAEADVSIRPGWFYHSSQDGNVRDVKNLLKLWFMSCGRNANILLNLPPDTRGLIHENDAKNLLEFNNALAEALSVDFAKGATVTADSIRDSSCSPENLLSDDENEFYASEDSCTTPEIIFELDGEKEFNSFSLQEVIELGHRVTGYEISALVSEDWTTLYKGICIGYRSAKHFPTVKTSRIKIKITSALHAPVLRSFSLYKFDEKLLEETVISASDKNILENGTAVVRKEDNSVDINFGGLVPFNLIKLNVPEITEFEIKLFNG
ncbi:MAG: alpha-L-fucosidase, partial [Acutalibacteraceae bacterium]|nr:alpha-L-fucosidase [Acutalibacteraceae bacterium]